MLRKPARVVVVLLSLVAAAGASYAASDLWFHVRVDEGDGAKVTVNLPLALVEKAATFLPEKHRHHLRFDHGPMDVEIDELREMWNEVRNSPDMTFVTVEEDDEKVRVWKEKGHVFVEVREDDGEEQVNVKVPVAVVDALLAGDEVNFRAAVQALVDHGEGNFVEVKDHDDHVRVWVDNTAEAR